METNLPGRIYKRDAGGGLGLDLIGDPIIDPRSMSATAVICTSDVDREGEIILPMGVATTNYRKNPIVLWEHGFSDSIPAPIAKCEHPDGSLALTYSRASLKATSYFTNRNRDSEQIFALVDERIVRATSIHVQPDYTQVRREGGAVLYPVSEMLEWSWCMLGVNPEAVQKAVDRNRLAGSAISEPIMKALRQHLPQRKAAGRGWTAPKSAETGPTIDGEPGETDWQDSLNDLPEGLALMVKAHASTSALCEAVQLMMAKLDNAKVRDALSNWLTHSQGVLSTLGSAISSIYPKQAPSMSDEDIQVAKSVVASNPAARMQAVRMFAKVNAVYRSTRSPLMAPMAKALKEICETPHVKPAAVPRPSMEEKRILSELEELRGCVADMKKSIQDALPFDHDAADWWKR